MNQELKQRLIGAIVVTALAAIFIPMLFDDPIENSSQSVSELVIPETPVNTGEESANKLPTGANQVLNTPDTGSETLVNTEEETELSADKQLPPDESLDDEPMINTEEGLDEPDEPANDSSSASLDTDVPGKTKQKIQETESSRQKSTSKQALEANTAEPVAKKPVKKTEKSVAKTAKPRSELSRWSIQAGTFSKKENAVSQLETLRKLGLPATMETTNGGLYRLKVGPSLDKKRAAEMKAKLDSHKIQSFLIAE